MKVRGKIALSLFVILAVIWFLFYLWITNRQYRTMLNYLKHQAEGIYNTVILSRHWISSKGGIYVKDEEGNYKLITPSHFVAEIASFAKNIFPYRIKIAVLDTRNPDHVPDEFEVEALKNIWEKRLKNYWKLVYVDGVPYFRYAAPLKFKAECQVCHFDYNMDTKGCVSISFPATSVYRDLRLSKFYMALFSMGSLGIIFVVIYLLINLFVLKPLEKFIKASSAVERGDMSVRVDISSKDEWGMLARQFNSMVEKIAEHRRELEEKIEQATCELKKAYENLRQTERFKSEFFSNITHDLKTPITAIKGVADLIIRKTNDQYAAIILKNVEKLSRMINDMLDCARLEYNQLELKKEKGDIIEVIEDTIFGVTPIAMDKGVEIKFSYTGDIQPIEFDEDKLSRALANIISNAIKFSPEGGKVLVKLNMQSSGAYISIEDFGPGIPDDEWNMVFDKFYKRSSDGVGLGLFIAKGIVEAHGGKIWLSRPDHEGIVFNIFIPKA